MFEWIVDFIKKNQPVSFTGMFAHTYYWITSSSGDYICPNPAFKLTDTDAVGIYCVHGTFDQSQSFSRITERLLQRGLPEHISSVHLVAFNGRYQGNGVEHFAEQLLAKIKENGHKKVVLLGHSRGGLVNAFFAEYLAEKHNIAVDIIISLGTPFYGSYLALRPLSLFSTSVRQMELGSVFLQTLTKKIIESRKQYYFFVAGDDYVVSAGCSHIPDYVCKNPAALITLGRHGHLSMVSSHELVEHTHTILSRHYGTLADLPSIVDNAIADALVDEHYFDLDDDDKMDDAHKDVLDNEQDEITLPSGLFD